MFFDGVKPSKIKVNRTKKRQRSKRIKQMCRYVDIVSICIHMHTDLLLNLGSYSVVKGFKGFSSLLVCFTFIFCHIDISSLYRGVFYIWIVFVITRISLYRGSLYRDFYIQFTVTLAGLKNIVRYTEDLVIKRFVKSTFQCIFLFLS